MSNNEGINNPNTQRIIDYIERVNDTNQRLATANTFYAGLIFGILAITTLWILWNLAKWGMGV